MKRLIDFPPQVNAQEPQIEVRRPQEVFSSIFKDFQLSQGKWAGQCVRFVNQILGTNIKGDASTWVPNFQYPVPGAAVLFDNHVAIVAGIIGDNIVLLESNYSLDERIDVGRTVPINSPKIRGYLIPNLHTAYTSKNTLQSL